MLDSYFSRNADGLQKTVSTSVGSKEEDEYMKEILIAIGGGLIGGIISPFVVSVLQHEVIWKRQKRLEIKYSIFNDTVRALSMSATDALDVTLQDQHKDERGRYHRPETKQLSQRSRGMVQAFFSEDACKAVFDAMGAKLTIKTAPSVEYEEKRTAAILKMANELSISKNR